MQPQLLNFKRLGSYRIQNVGYITVLFVGWVFVVCFVDIDFWRPDRFILS